MFWTFSSQALRDGGGILSVGSLQDTGCVTLVVLHTVSRRFFRFRERARTIEVVVLCPHERPHNFGRLCSYLLVFTSNWLGERKDREQMIV